MEVEVTSGSLPEAVRRILERTCGEGIAIEALGGLSGSDVLRVHGRRGSAVVKGGVSVAEIEFYRAVAPLLEGRSVLAPSLHWAGRAAGRRWLVLEDVPHPLPRERWGGDREVLAVLARLHEGGPLPRLRARDAYRPVWTAQITASALAVFSNEVAAVLAPVLDAMREAAGHLFAPRCPISGDANPSNWGLRADGTLVLFDWERFCLGTPALDLAPVLPGLGSANEHCDLARRFLTVTGNSASQEDVDALARDIRLAKAWNVVELLAGMAEGRVEDGATADWLRTAVPEWVVSIGWSG